MVQMKFKKENIYSKFFPWKTFKIFPDIRVENKLNYVLVKGFCKKALNEIKSIATETLYTNPPRRRSSSFNYCPLIKMFYSLDKTKRLRERCLLLTYNGNHWSLLFKDGLISINQSNIQATAMQMFKTNYGLFPEIKVRVNNYYNFRNANDFKVLSMKTPYCCTKSISYRGPKTWVLFLMKPKKWKSLKF